MPLPVVIPECELFDPKTEEFYTTKETSLLLEHSLISISKWEEKWHVPFIEGPDPRSKEKTEAMWQDYFRCMVISPKNVDPMVFRAMPLAVRNEIVAYINEQRTASSVKKPEGPKGPSEQITSELIYFWMIHYSIPAEYDKWHLSRLIMLIRIAQAKLAAPDTKGKKSKAERSLDYARISAARRKAAAAKKR